jgi:hypothetical protein
MFENAHRILMKREHHIFDVLVTVYVSSINEWYENLNARNYTYDRFSIMRHSKSSINPNDKRIEKCFDNNDCFFPASTGIEGNVIRWCVQMDLSLQLLLTFLREK